MTVDAKLARLDDLLAERGLASVWFARPTSFVWLTGGDNAVDRAADVGVAAVGYDGTGLRVVTNDIEADRLADEELDGVPVEAYPWHASDLASAVAERASTPGAADFDVPGFADVEATGLRQPVTDDDVERYRELGDDVAAAVETICRDCTRSDTERAVASRLRAELTARGIDSPVVLVGGERRAGAYRHYTPTDASLDGYALVSVTATRGGLAASCTRTVAFDEPEWLAERHAAAARVETTALAATRAVGRDGGTAGDVFDAIVDAYDAVGVPDEWRNHHQGGAAGFAGREWIATPESDAVVHLPQGYAWNPTVRGAKSEDTVLVTADGFEVLTKTGDWPTRNHDAVGHEVSLSRPAPLR
ncbi:M24 family metallopeptidase [Haloarchaeobius iranensis]|uniref:Xaa-Pro aminopeptidase n=1 Tax=Haloarchaeobius iranensis TaxID=996166 RepID=A0A1G9UDP3_9EURY|nr:M24 family metallopeptidase [Haloarchaeobius iranensis]SDM57814.1 Xaa-Pro aminopeptidase [Haloarchaeobius iranensis]